MAASLAVDHSKMKLGKRLARLDARTLRLAKYMKDLPPAPDTVDYSKGNTSWGMMLNDSLGDCTCAGIGHAIQVVTLNATGTMFTPPDADVLTAYEAQGYVPGNPGTDNGAVELDVLNYVRTVGMSGKKLLAYADPDPQNIEHVKQSIYLFGVCYIGLALPLTAQDQAVWDVVNSGVWRSLKYKLFNSDPTAPWSWGGHAVIVIAYNAIGPICITWGALKQMTWAFWKKYCDEAHGLLWNEWIGQNNLSASGFDLSTLQSDLAAIVG